MPGSPLLFDFYKKMGYRVCTYTSELCCQASDSPTSVRQIDAEEYSIRRPDFLPKGSILQENENIIFLQTQADFYLGDDFLLAAWKDVESY